MKKNKGIPTPKVDPRGYSNLQGSPMDVRDHEADSGHTATEHYQGDQAFKSITEGLGPKTSYKIETRQMYDANNISEAMRKDEQ